MAAAATNGVAENRTANAQNELTQVGSSAVAYSTTGNLTTGGQGHRPVVDEREFWINLRNRPTEPA